MDGAAGQAGLEQATADVRGAPVPSLDRLARRIRTEQRGDLLERPRELDDLRGQRLRVGYEDVRPDGGVCAGDACGVAKARADAGTGAVEGRLLGGAKQEHVREDVREVARDRHHPIVGLGVGRRRLRAEPDQHRVQAVVEDPGRARARCEVPGRLAEEVGAGVFDAGRLGARDRVPADEALVRGAVHDRELGGADVGDGGVVRRRGERFGHESRQRPYWGAHEADLRIGHGGGQGARRAIHGTALGCRAQHLRIEVPADDLMAALPRSEPDRAADQPHTEDSDPHVSGSFSRGAASAPPLRSGRACLPTRPSPCTRR